MDGIEMGLQPPLTAGWVAIQWVSLTRNDWQQFVTVQGWNVLLLVDASIWKVICLVRKSVQFDENCMHLRLDILLIYWCHRIEFADAFFLVETVRAMQGQHSWEGFADFDGSMWIAFLFKIWPTKCMFGLHCWNVVFDFRSTAVLSISRK